MSGSSMDEIYHYQRHIYDLTRKYYLLGRDRLVADLAVPGDGVVLEIGCGTGRNLIKIARAYPEARLFGLDISEAMLATARTSIARAGLANRITVEQGDACGFDAAALFPVTRFDRIVMSYTLSMIPDWEVALSHAATVLAPRGSLHLVDFGQQERLPRGFRTLLFAWLARFGVDPRAELPTALAAIVADTGTQLDFVSRYRGYAWSAKVSR